MGGPSVVWSWYLFSFGGQEGVLELDQLIVCPSGVCREVAHQIDQWLTDFEAPKCACGIHKPTYIHTYMGESSAAGGRRGWEVMKMRCTYCLLTTCMGDGNGAGYFYSALEISCMGRVGS